MVAFRPGGGTSVLYCTVGLLKYVGASVEMELLCEREDVHGKKKQDYKQVRNKCIEQCE